MGFPTDLIDKISGGILTASDHLQRDKQNSFPSGDFASEIPLWINFKAFSYTSEANARAARIGLGSIIAGQDDIWLALPHQVQVSNQVNYKEGESPESSYTLGTLKEKAMGWLEGLVDGVPFLGAAKKAVEAKVGRMNIQLSEAIFNGVALRSFNYSFELVPKTIAEAGTVSDICDTLQRLAYPRGGLRTSKMYHPPLWGIGVYSGINGTRMRQWDMNPQNCVLTSVNINKTAEQGGPSAVEGDLPSVIGLDLSFTELEPNLRSMEGNDLMSRSRMKAGFGAR
jgi:hypothetical protein